MRRRKDDLLWKSVLEYVFPDFLRFFFPAADDLFQMEKGFEYLDKELDQLDHSDHEVPGTRFVDKLVKVFLRVEESKYMLIHIEVQGQKGTEDLSARMFRYWYRIKDRYDRPVAAFAILTDERRSFRPQAYIEQCVGTTLDYKFNVCKLLDHNEAELRANLNPFSVVILVVLKAINNKNADDILLKTIKHDLIYELNKRQVSKRTYRGIMNFLKHYMRFKSPDMMFEFEEEVKQLNEKITAMGIEEYLLQRAEREGMEKGREEERFKLVRNLILNLGLTNGQIMSVTGVSLNFVKRIRAEMRVQLA